MDITKMSDDQILKAAGTLGPALIGKELFEAAQKVRKRNPTGKLGKSLLGPAFGEKPKAAPKSKAASKAAASDEDDVPGTNVEITGNGDEKVGQSVGEGEKEAPKPAAKKKRVAKKKAK